MTDIKGFDWSKMTTGIQKIGTGFSNPFASPQTEKTTPLFANSNNTNALDEQSLLDEFADLEALVKGDQVEETEGTEATEAVQETANAQATTTSKLSDEEKKEIEEKVKELEEEYEKNVEKMEKVQAEIETLAEEVAENITIAAAAQESAVKENEKQSQEVVDEQLKAYIEANKEGGEGMTREQLQENIKGAIPGAPNIADALNAAIEANEQIADIDALLGELNTLTIDTKAIEDELNACDKLLNPDAQEVPAATEEAESEKKKCDPIGFVGADNVEYNFFTDKNGDGALSETNEFLGADNQWAEMTALDTDADGSVNINELVASGVKLQGTNGSTIASAEDYTNAFGENFSIDLNSYAEGGEHSAIDTTTDSDNDGTVDQELLGTFTVNANDTEISGYNTLDDVDWLSENYGVKVSETEAEEADVDELKYNKVQEFTEYIEMATERNELAKEQLAEIEKNIGFESDAVCDFKSAIADKAQANAASFVKSLDETQEESAETSEEVDKAEENEETNDVNTDMTDAEVEEQAQEDTSVAENVIIYDGDEAMDFMRKDLKIA